jgi:hypothetical protein
MGAPDSDELRLVLEEEAESSNPPDRDPPAEPAVVDGPMD